jgi:hypothetical protein
MAWPDITLPPESFGAVYLSEDWDSQYLLKEMIEKKIDIFKAKMPGFYPRIKSMPDGNSFKRRWMHGEGYPTELVGTWDGSTYLTVTGNLFGKTVTRASVLNVVRVGAVLQYLANGVLYAGRVVGVDATDPIIQLEATGGLTLPGSGSSQTWKRISKPYTETKNSSDPVMASRDLLYTGTEIFEGTIALQESRIRIGMQNDVDEIEYQTDRMLEDMEIQIATAAVHQIPTMSDGGVPLTMRETDEPRMFGLLWWIGYLYGSGGRWENASLYRDLSGKPPYIEDLQALVAAMDDNNSRLNSYPFEIWTTPAIKDYINTYGISQRRQTYDDKSHGTVVDEIQFGRRKDPIKVNADPDWRADCLAIIDMDAPHIGNVTGNRLRKKSIPTGTMLYIKDQWSQQKEGLRIDRPKEFAGMLYGIDLNG